MKPLIVLLLVFGASLLATWFLTGAFNFTLSGRIAMAAMLLFTAIGHFAFVKGMEMMIPGPIPYKRALVYITGIFEIAAAIGLLFVATAQITGWMLVFFFILILPANINAALRNVDYQKATYEGNSAAYLWFRLPLQVFFIVWVYYFTIL